MVCLQEPVEEGKLLQEETLSLRIADACNQIFIEDCQSICHHSAKRLEDCMKKNTSMIFICQIKFLLLCTNLFLCLFVSTLANNYSIVFLIGFVEFS